MSFDTAIIVIALVISVAIGVWSMRYAHLAKTSAEYHTARGAFTPKLFFFTVFATTFSAFTVVGLPAMFYTHGVGAFWFMWVGIALTPLTVRFIGVRIVAAANENPNYSSPVGLLMSPYRSAALTWCVSIVTIVVIVPYLVLQISGVGKFMLSLSNGGISYLMGTLLCCVLVGAYLFKGGALADARTDFGQGIALLVGTALLGLVFLFESFGGRAFDISRLQEAQLLSVPGPRGYFTLPVLISFGVVFTLISVATPQVSQKFMGVTDPKQVKTLFWWYPIAGTIVVALAGVAGLYAASNLTVASPDFVIGDVLRHLTAKEGGYRWILAGVSVAFVTGIVAAAVSTIDSVLLSISGIVSDNLFLRDQHRAREKSRGVMIGALALAFFLSFRPPTFIVDLARIQLTGLMAVLPCLLAPLYGVRNTTAGWLSILFGLLPVALSTWAGVRLMGFDPGLAALVSAVFGLLLGNRIGGTSERRNA